MLHAVGVQLEQPRYTRRSSAEGVNLDQELISMTTYQQAFNAAARLVQASKDMYDVLIQMVR